MSAERVKTAVSELRDAGVSDAEIAAKVGCGISTISMWATGERAKRTGDYMFNLFAFHDAKCVRPRKKKAA